MLKDSVFLFSFFVLIALATVHHVALALDWYYTMPSLDLVTHFLGGLWVVVTSLWFVFRSGYVNNRTASGAVSTASLAVARLFTQHLSRKVLGLLSTCHHSSAPQTERYSGEWIIKTIPFSKKSAALVVIVVIVAVGTLWELFELWAGIIIKEGYALDTLLDGAMDVLGALTGLFFFTTLNNS